MNIYITGLNYSINDADLNDLFAEYGEITSAKVIMDRETGRSRGFGFVEMPNDAEGQRAIDTLNGTELEQKVISVSVARPRTERPSNGGGYRDRGGYNNRRY
ncbi:RNA-binding protein [Parabacteroides sp. AF17-28]|uniref:RNA recognition motif domain-containing protein n=1 Tax=Parabacteroides sp. AF17-28 TaxID=2292241 RepID=UPI000F00E8FD|nr:RNA-binding protein [Parabacteroides sp. AF17-28]RHR59554.1 RNA-binding protein [Parabacteroides sp. AF17-28]